MARYFSILLASAVFLAASLPWNSATGLARAASVASLEKALDEGRLTREESAAIEATIEQARAQGLPTAPFAAKVDEGLAKRIPGRAILHALEAMRDDYAFSRDTLAQTGGTPSPEDIALAGDSLRLGLSRQELSALAAQKPPAAMLATAARTLAYLKAVDFPSALANGILSQGLASGSLTPGWTQLFRVVQRAREAGVTDQALAEAATRTLLDGGGPGELLQDLGFTGRDTRQAPGDSGN
jgi:hypothetical protein